MDYIKGIFGFSFAAYLIGCLAGASFDISTWSEPLRLTVAMGVAGIAISVTIVLFLDGPRRRAAKRSM